MSIHIDSEIRASGTRYNGVWNLNGYIQGEYEVVEQYIDTKDIPWITSDSNTVIIVVDEEEYEFPLFSVIDGSLDTYSVSTDIDDIALYIKNRFDTISTTLSLGLTTDVTIDTDGQSFEITFNNVITLKYSEMPMQHIFETGDEDLTSNNFYWGYKNIDIHPHLYVQCPEIDGTIINEPDVIDAAFIFHTENRPLTGMRVFIQNGTNQLTMRIYRKTIPGFPLPIRNKWDLILRAV